MSWSLAWKECWDQQTAAYGLTSEPWRTATWVIKNVLVFFSAALQRLLLFIHAKD